MTAKEGGTRGQQMGKLLVFRWLSPENVLNVTLLNLALPFNFVFLCWLNSEVIMNSNAKTTWLFRTPKS